MNFELVFIPYPGISHLRSTVEMAKLLVDQENRLTISVLILPFLSGSAAAASPYVEALSAASSDRLRYEVISTGGDQTTSEPEATTLDMHIENHIPNVRRAVAKLFDHYSTIPNSPKIAGFVLDMFCTSLIDVANEFHVPSYLFYTSNAGVLALGFHVQHLYDNNNYHVRESDFEDSETELVIPGLIRPYPVKCLPHGLASELWLPIYVNHSRRFKEMKEQKFNAFEMVEELGLAVQIKRYWRGDHLGGVAAVDLVKAEEIERAVRCLMEQDSEVRKRVKEMSKKCHAALMDGGSSRIAMQKFIQDVVKNIALPCSQII
ncbi:hypothetical protein DY000_02042023 [Brassica cretica]|uniref:UDP-glycosyltransferases domain-containing protein n=1 Tax=Brassica cretica TaxID=69181 RepID=A0ABQ7B922_BRACR|nr:hypothetical protein DY000_02042023 [Brassica cretica]